MIEILRSQICDLEKNKAELDSLLLSAYYELDRLKGSQYINKVLIEDILIYLEDEGLIDIVPYPGAACGEL